MLKRSRFLQLAVITVPVILITILIYFRDSIVKIGLLLPKCPFYAYTGYYCPGCGNTRSVIHFLHGDLIGSLRYNIAPLTLMVILFLLYLELVTYAFGRYKRILTRNSYFWFTFLGLAILYFIVRNFIPHFIS
jgi:hypothetical protein